MGSTIDRVNPNPSSKYVDFVKSLIEEDRAKFKEVTDAVKNDQEIVMKKALSPDLQ